MTNSFGLSLSLAKRMLRFLLLFALLTDTDQTTFAENRAHRRPGTPARLFINHAQIVRTNPTALMLGPDGTATLSVISTVEPALGGTAQIHVEIEHITPSGPPTHTFVADATDTLSFTATGTDTLNNPLPDGTPVTWLINGAPAQIAQDSSGTRQIQTQLLNGSATATLRSPSAAGTITLTAQIGTASDTATVTGTVPTAQITSTASTLDIAESDTATLTLTTDAADGTVVNWFASNGTLAQRATVVTGGTTSTSLFSGIVNGAREGPVGVIATIGSRVVSWAGSFIYTAPVKIELDELYLAGAGQTTFARIKAPGHPNARAHVFVNGAQAITLAPVNNALVPDNTVNGKGIRLDSSGQAVIQVTSTLEPGLAANAQIQVEIETGLVEGTPTFVKTDTWVSVVNFAKHQAAADFFIGALGGEIQGGPGMVGSIAGGFLLVGDAGALGKNVGRLFGVQEGDFDGFEFTLIAAGLLCSGTPLDTVPTVSRAILAILKTLPADQSVKAVKLLRSCYKLLLTDIDAVLHIWSLFQRIFPDSDLIKAVFKTADGSLETFKAVAQGFGVYGDELMAFLKRKSPNTSEQIANIGKTIKCLNDAAPTLKNAIPTSALPKAMDDIALIVKGGTEVIDPAALAKILTQIASFPSSVSYKVTHILNHLSVTLRESPSVEGLFRSGTGIVSVIENQLVSGYTPSLGGFLYQLQEAARRAPELIAIERKGGQFYDLILTGQRHLEVKASAHSVLMTATKRVTNKAGDSYATVEQMAAQIVDVVDRIVRGGIPGSSIGFVTGRGLDDASGVTALPVMTEVIAEIRKTYPGFIWEKAPAIGVHFPSLFP